MKRQKPDKETHKIYDWFIKPVAKYLASRRTRRKLKRELNYEAKNNTDQN